jgi:hypothetical protein
VFDCRGKIIPPKQTARIKHFLLLTAMITFKKPKFSLIMKLAYDNLSKNYILL